MKTFKVVAIPNASPQGGLTYFAVSGPGVSEFAMMDRIAKLLEAALNAAHDFATKS